MEKNKFVLLIFLGIVLITCGFSILLLNKTTEIREKIKKNKSVEKYLINQKTDVNIEPDNSVSQYDYIGVIEIPSINLKRGFLDKDSIYNDVSYNIEVLIDSDMPDIENGNFILAAHSGNTMVSYFKNIHNLSLNDNIYIYYNGHKYIYKVMNKYQIEKTGYANIVRNNNKNTLTLITCISNTNYQLVVICELIETN